MADLKQQKEDIRASTDFAEQRDGDWAKENREVYMDYRSARAARYKDMVENDRFYHNIQYTEAEETEIIARGQAPLTINVMYSIIKQMLSLITSDNPMWYVDPVGDTDKEFAYTMRNLLNATWYLSKGGRQFAQIGKETLITGLGWGIVTPKMEPSFYVKFSWVPYHQVYASSMTRDFDFSDSENLVISNILSVGQASKLLSLDIKEVQKLADEDATQGGGEEEQATNYPRYSSPVIKGQDGKNKTLRVIQRFSLEYRKVYVVKPLGGGNPLSRKIYFTLPPFLQKLRDSGAVQIDETGQTVLAKYVSAGSYCQRYYLPIEQYPIVPFIDEFNGNPYPLGEVDYLYGIQRALNKFVLLAILNATLANTMKVQAVKGTINKDEFTQSYAVPGSLIEYEWTEGQPAPEQINPQPLSSSFFDFPNLLIHIMEYMTGIFGVIQGNAQEAPRTASGLMSLQNYGGQKVKLIGRSMGDSLATLGDAAIALYQNYAPYNQELNYFAEEQQEQVSVAYNKVSSKNGQLLIENDISSGKFKARVRAVQSYGSERAGKANLLATLSAQTKSPALIGPILKLADVPEADKIVEQLDIVNQLSQTKAQLEKEVERMNQVNKQLQNEIIQKSQQVTVTEFEAQLEILFNKIKNELGSEINKEMNDFQTQWKAEVAKMQQQSNQTE